MFTPLACCFHVQLTSPGMIQVRQLELTPFLSSLQGSVNRCLPFVSLVDGVGNSPVPFQSHGAASLPGLLSYRAEHASSEERGIPGESVFYLVGQKSWLDSDPAGLDLPNVLAGGTLAKINN